MTQKYIIEVRFYVDNEQYGHERYTIDADTRKEAIQQAMRKSEQALYADGRIDYTRRVSILNVEGITNEIYS